MATTELLTLNRLSRQLGIRQGSRPLVYLVRRERIHGRSGRYDPDEILGVLLGLDVRPDAITVGLLKDRIHAGWR